jgi:putative membrane protein
MNTLIRFVPVFTAPIALLNVASAQDYLRFGRGPGWGFLEGLLQLFFLILIVLGIIFVVQALRARRSFDLPGLKPVTPHVQDAALQLLRERLAKGEIDPDDYEARRRILSGESKVS